ncbi:MAG: pyrroline-5-carboxylate reductase [Parvularculaceae bacterium]|nr:pyrroline-5-carboxylate reductase [Parvularculaceae bacterium]
MSRKISVALVGAGAMGGALLKGWLASDAIDAATSAVFEPMSETDAVARARISGVRVNPDPATVSVDALVLAVKPQAVDEVLPRFAPIARRSLTVSVMAGVSLAGVEARLGSPRAVRAMPNLPAQVGAGVSGLFGPPSVSPADRRIAETLLQAAGEVVWVQSEREIDVVTAVSGSGPAYFFLLVEALADAGAALGLESDAAARLARATAIGSGALLAADPRPAAELRMAVTSPGGTTEAALRALDGDERALRTLMKAALAAAARRASEISGT